MNNLQEEFAELVKDTLAFFREHYPVNAQTPPLTVAPTPVQPRAITLKSPTPAPSRPIAKVPLAPKIEVTKIDVETDAKLQLEPIVGEPQSDFSDIHTFFAKQFPQIKILEPSAQPAGLIICTLATSLQEQKFLQKLCQAIHQYFEVKVRFVSQAPSTNAIPFLQLEPLKYYLQSGDKKKELWMSITQVLGTIF